MHTRSPKWLEDIRDAAAFIGHVTQGRTLAVYSADRLLRQAVERNFEIIGEAIKRLAQTDPGTAARIAQVPQIIAFRNVLIHGYDLVDHALVWSTVQMQLPVLLRDVDLILSSNNAGLNSGVQTAARCCAFAVPAVAIHRRRHLRGHQHVDRAVERGGGAGQAFALGSHLAAGQRQALAQRRRHTARMA